MVDGIKTPDLTSSSSLTSVVGNKEISPGVFNTVRASVESFAAQLTPIVSQNIGLDAQFAVINSKIANNTALIDQANIDIQNAETDIAALQQGQITSSIAYATYAELTAAVPSPTAGARAEVTADAGTHTDPVSGLTVSNSGVFRGSTSPAGWTRIAELPAPLESPVFQGLPTAPTPHDGEYSTQIPTSKFVADMVDLDIVTVTNQEMLTQQFDSAWWSLSSATVSANVVAGPLGDVDADKLIEDSATSTHSIGRPTSVAPAIGDRVTITWVVKAAERTTCMVQYIDTSSNVFRADIDLAAASIKMSLGSQKIDVSIELMANGFYAVSMSFTILAAGGGWNYLNLADSLGNYSYTGTPGNGIYVWAFQITFTSMPAPIVKNTFSIVPKTVALRRPRLLNFTTTSAGVGACDDADILYICAIGSQSNGQGLGDLPLVATAPLYPAKALMLSNTASIAGPHVFGSSSAEFADLIETTANGQKESACSGLTNGIISLMEAATGRQLRVLSFVHALASTDYKQLKRGGVNSTSEAYRWFLQALTDSVRIARSKGFRPVFLAYNWAGNELSFDSAEEIWANHMCQNYRNMDEDIRRITGQTENWAYFIDSIRFVGSVANASAFAPTIHAGNRLASLRNSNIKIAHPWYQRETNSVDTIHLSCVGQNKRGQALARAVVDEMFGTGWEPFTARKAYRTGATAITVEFQGSATGNLVMDVSDTIVTSTGLPAGNYLGFRFDDYSGSPPTIISHTISGRQITFTLSGAPTGYSGRLAYATERNPGVTTDTPVTGARGCLRLDTAHALLYSLGTDYDWCNPFVIDCPI